MLNSTPSLDLMKFYPIITFVVTDFVRPCHLVLVVIKSIDQPFPFLRLILPHEKVSLGHLSLNIDLLFSHMPIFLPHQSELASKAYIHLLPHFVASVVTRTISDAISRFLHRVGVGLHLGNLR